MKTNSISISLVIEIELVYSMNKDVLDEADESEGRSSCKDEAKLSLTISNACPALGLSSAGHNLKPR